MKKRIVSSIMCLAMLLTLLPVSAFAAPGDTSARATVHAPGELVYLTGSLTGDDATGYTVTAAKADLPLRKDNNTLGTYKHYVGLQFQATDAENLEDTYYVLSRKGTAIPEASTIKDVIGTFVSGDQHKLDDTTGIDVVKASAFEEDKDADGGVFWWADLDTNMDANKNVYVAKAIVNGSECTLIKYTFNFSAVTLVPLDSEVVAAPVADVLDKNNADKYMEVTATATTAEDTDKDTVTTVALRGTVKPHWNGQKDTGYWVGIGVTAPEAAAKVKYAFSTAKDDVKDLSEVAATDLDENVDGNGSDGIAFYANASAQTPKTWAAVQWIDADNKAINATPAIYKMDLSGVTCDKIKLNAVHFKPDVDSSNEGAGITDAMRDTMWAELDARAVEGYYMEVTHGTGSGAKTWPMFALETSDFDKATGANHSTKFAWSFHNSTQMRDAVLEAGDYKVSLYTYTGAAGNLTAAPEDTTLVNEKTVTLGKVTVQEATAAGAGDVDGYFEVGDPDVTIGDMIETLPTPEAPSGSSFLGWVKKDAPADAAHISTAALMATKPTNGDIYVPKMAESVTVHFDANGATTGAAPADITVEKTKGFTAENIETIEAATLTKTNYTLDGWGTSADGGKTITEINLETATFSEDTTLYAIWKANPVVTFNLNYTGAAAPTEVVTGSDGKVAVPEDPERAGYIFKGWGERATATTFKTGAEIAEQVFTADTTLYAMWESDSIVSAVLKDDGNEVVAGVTVTPAINGNTATLTISGIIPTIVTDTADTYTLSYKLASQEVGDAAKTITVKFAKDNDTGVIAVSSVTGTDVTNDKLVIGANQYTVVVGDLLEATIEATAPEVTVVEADISGTDADKTAVKDHFDNPINAPTASTQNGLVAAAAEMVASPEDTSVTELVAALEAENTALEVYLDVKPTGYVSAAASRSLTLEITPMVRVVEVDPLDQTTTPVNDVDPVPVTNFDGTKTEPVTISVPVPTGFIGSGDTGNVYVRHTKDGTLIEIIKASATTTAVTFTASSFSKYEIVVDNRTANVSYTAGAGATMPSDPVPVTDFNPSHFGYTLPVPTKEGYTFNGWVMAGDTTNTPHKTLDEAFFNALAAAYKETSADVVLTANFTQTPTPPPPSGPTGGGSVSNKVSIGSTTNGKITANNYNPKEGDTVTITATPNDGYVTGTVTVKDAKGNDVTVTKTGDNTFTFTMPKDKVTVNATFVKEDTSTFTDVNDGDYYADAVKWAVEKGITNGLTATTFGPNNSCTRGQMVTFLWRAAGSPAATATNSFTDVASGEYYYNAVLWAVEKGITNGTSATTFSPNATVNRGQTVTFLYRYAESPAATGDISFTDVAADAFYADAVKWAVAEEITNGTSATTFAPNSNCTRGQIVTFLYRQMAE